jgi:ubiquinone/menaquinone biosynthesis C-methylase UbiE
MFAACLEKCRIAVLGVTPELVLLPWPRTVVLDAFDHSAEMIANVWQEHPTVPSRVHEADWQSLPLAAGQIHAAVGDGLWTTIPALAQYPEVLKELHRVLVARGRVIIRCFIQPDVAEPVPSVVAAALSGGVGSFHALKWRLAMALVNPEDASVAVADIHRAFEANFPSRLALSQVTGWTQEQIDTIDAYRHAATRYTFPTVSQMREQCLPWFEVLSVEQGSYELAERCPTWVLVRRDHEVGHGSE